MDTRLLAILPDCTMFSSIVELLVKSWRKSFVDPSGLPIFISGCDSGIGRKLAEYFAGMGCLVFAGCLDPAEEASLPDNVRVVGLNLKEEESVREAVAAVKAALEEEGKELWALVNNAGVCVFSPFEWQTAKQMEWQLDVNVKGTMRLTKECIPLLRKSKGRIITVSSVNGDIAYPGLTTYSATKFALEGFSNALRIELGQRHGIRVIIVQPSDYARVTSIMSRHNSHVEDMWEDMPIEQQEQEKPFFLKYQTSVLKNYGLSSPTSLDGSPLLRDMKEAVLGINPSAKYLSAPLYQKIFYKVLAMIPQQCADFVLILLSKYVLNSVGDGEEISDSLLKRDKSANGINGVRKQTRDYEKNGCYSIGSSNNNCSPNVE